MTDVDIDLSTDPENINAIPMATATAIPVFPTNTAATATTTTAVTSNITQNPKQQQPQQTFPLVTSFSTSNVMTNQSLKALREQGFPLGLAQELGNTKATYPLRFWIVDNSGYVHSLLLIPNLAQTMIVFG
jgi:hypothetical protein